MDEKTIKYWYNVNIRENSIQSLKVRGGENVASIVKSFAILWVDGYLVDVETKTIDGQPMISVVGLGDTAVKEARERVESALNDGNYAFPQMKVVINLAPSDLKKAALILIYLWL